MHMHLQRVLVRGGPGGHGGWGPIFGQWDYPGGDGGIGIEMHGAEVLFRRQLDVQGGQPGAGAGTAPPGVKGKAIVGGYVKVQKVKARSVSMTSPRHENQAVFVVIHHGKSGEPVWLSAALDSDVREAHALEGIWLLGAPLLLDNEWLGTIKPTGSMTALLPIPELGPGVEGVSITLQTLFGSGDTLTMGPVNIVTLLDMDV
jgi:hypothetical protein